MDELTTAVAANSRRGTALQVFTAAAIAVVVMVLGALLGHPWIGGFVGVGVGAGAVWALMSGAESALVARAGGQPVGPSEEPRLHNVVEGLCAAAGVPQPALFVTESDGRNAMAAGRDVRRAPCSSSHVACSATSLVSNSRASSPTS